MPVRRMALIIFMAALPLPAGWGLTTWAFRMVEAGRDTLALILATLAMALVATSAFFNGYVAGGARVVQQLEPGLRQLLETVQQETAQQRGECAHKEI
jgi:hypothetical protein